MGVSAYAYTRLGCKFSREDAFEEVGTRFECRKGHIQKDEDHKFCPSCGEKIQKKVVEVPKKGWKEYARVEGCDPKDLYHDMECGEGEVILSNSSSCQSSMKEEGANILAIEVGSAGEYCSQTDAQISLEGVEGKKKDLQKVMDMLGIGDREIRLYTSLYWSV